MGTLTKLGHPIHHLARGDVYADDTLPQMECTSSFALDHAQHWHRCLHGCSLCLLDLQQHLHVRHLRAFLRKRARLDLLVEVSRRVCVPIVLVIHVRQNIQCFFAMREGLSTYTFLSQI